eukprot:6430243-Prymnesium_polylepis.1
MGRSRDAANTLGTPVSSHRGDASTEGACPIGATKRCFDASTTSLISANIQGQGGIPHGRGCIGHAISTPS